ncbi:triacylglycerol lipase OBL1-like [Tasmannia lanceolata]|uniref:triacylglycerol lipase OBL1-like n=1 Tax=Tasmannia lanceolata TaxID=3420 RepID=UPI0040642218
MASLVSDHDYMIFRPEKVGFLDVISLLLFRRRLGDYKFVDSSPATKFDLQNAPKANWIVALTLIIQKILSLISVPLYLLGVAVEFFVNLLSLNGGILGLVFHIVTVSLVIPKRDSATFRSIIGHIDGRTDLYKSSSLVSYLPQMKIANDIKVLDLCMMAAKVAYENQAYITNVVTNHWKMQFVGFFNCWNEFLKDKTTQAFMFCDRAKDAQVIIVAFRGTEPFNAKDWSTDVDLSWMSMGNDMGRVHLGFMKALGLQDETDYHKGWPKEHKEEQGKPLAYYSIRTMLSSLLQQHKNAQIIVTGHSLGGALAALFPSILMLHQEDTILSNFFGIVTFGQPRVGDSVFASYMTTQMSSKLNRSCCRVVYRYDVVPRVPFDDPISQFTHFGFCFYYTSWYKGKVLEEEPDKNYFSPKYLPSKYYNAWLDFFRALFIGKTQGKDFKEGWVSILYRAIGFLIPGLASHSPRDYLNAARLGKITLQEMDIGSDKV